MFCIFKYYFVDIKIEYYGQWEELIKYLSNDCAYTFGIKHLPLTIYISLMLLSFCDQMV